MIIASTELYWYDTLHLYIEKFQNQDIWELEELLEVSSNVKMSFHNF